MFVSLVLLSRDVGSGRVVTVQVFTHPGMNVTRSSSPNAYGHRWSSFIWRPLAEEEQEELEEDEEAKETQDSCQYLPDSYKPLPNSLHSKSGFYQISMTWHRMTIGCM